MRDGGRTMATLKDIIDSVHCWLSLQWHSRGIRKEQGVWASTETEEVFIPEQQFKLHQDWLEVQPLRDYPHAMAVFRKSDHLCLGWMLKENVLETPIPFDPKARGRLVDTGKMDEVSEKWKVSKAIKAKL